LASLIEEERDLGLGAAAGASRAAEAGVEVFGEAQAQDSN
jgi:hypothetical protein